MHIGQRNFFRQGHSIGHVPRGTLSHASMSSRVAPKRCISSSLLNHLFRRRPHAFLRVRALAISLFAACCRSWIQSCAIRLHRYRILYVSASFLSDESSAFLTARAARANAQSTLSDAKSNFVFGRFLSRTRPWRPLHPAASGVSISEAASP